MVCNFVSRGAQFSHDLRKESRGSHSVQMDTGPLVAGCGWCRLYMGKRKPNGAVLGLAAYPAPLVISGDLGTLGLA